MSRVAPFIVVLSLASGRGATAQTAERAPFDPVASVVMHPRCMNCHQDESPRQTDGATIHRPLVVRGKDGHGVPTQPCQTCHQATNSADGFVPGVATWHLAPLSMKWEGRTKGADLRADEGPRAERRPSHGRRGHRTHEDGSARPLGVGPRQGPAGSTAFARSVCGSPGSVGSRRHAVPARRVT